MFFRTFGGSLCVTVVALAVALVYRGGTGLAVAAILGVLEISLSFDNAVVNATVLRTMSAFWQKIFLTVGVLIAVIGMRLLFPVLVVSVTAKLTPAQVIHLALSKGSVDTPGSYGFLLREAHPAIAAFGGAFLLLLFLGFILDEREITWLTWLERPLARIGKLDQLAVVVTLAAIAGSAYAFAPGAKIATVLLAGSMGTIAYILVDGLGGLFEEADGESTDADESSVASAVNVALKVGKAAFVSFLYLEVLDASFSFDGVIGAFAITSDPIIIALGLGIGAMFIRSLTVYLVRKGTLDDYVYLEHGALWAIGALAVLLLITIRYDVPEVVTGLIGVGFIGAALVSSLVRNRRMPPGADTESSAPTGLLRPAAI
ncbi:MAG TPA: DUF475 domain-containing protein [Jatrophihabitantaceae bacterium]|jgi:hypothetical protein|nr:DUF475 domain-containing protein [Jatrophihabitantaceae bacterium]